LPEFVLELKDSVPEVAFGQAGIMKLLLEDADDILVVVAGVGAGVTIVHPGPTASFGQCAQHSSSGLGTASHWWGFHSPSSTSGGGGQSVTGASVMTWSLGQSSAAHRLSSSWVG
jgi:hypothetical protein